MNHRLLHPPIASSLVIRRLMLGGLIVWGICQGTSALAQQPLPGGATNALEIRSASVNNKAVPLRRNGDVNFGATPENIAIVFRPGTNSDHAPIRLRYKLEGYENTWRDGLGQMLLTIRFFNAAGDQVGQNVFAVSGESPGWNGSIKTSSLTHRREGLVVPPQASRLWIVISSAGPPASVGAYVVANLLVAKSSSNSPPQVLMDFPPESQMEEEGNRMPDGWRRDGTHSSMAKIVSLGQSPAPKAFAILDDDVASHAEWHNINPSAPTVIPGDHLVVEWNEMYSVGVGDITVARYPTLPQGEYRFRVAGFDLYGNPTGVEDFIKILVPPPFWRTSWFLSVVVTTLLAIVLGGGRYHAWRRMQVEMVRLKNQQALEKERLRIAQDIHDDLGARITEISLVSALAGKKLALPQSASDDFDRISRMSRELVSALYETVWAVNPENDNLDALGNYLCQMVNQLCEPAQLPCRLEVLDLPHDIQVSSQIRHNVIMAVKEAVHNVIKHAGAGEMTLQVSYEKGILKLRVQDNGVGFNAADCPTRNGLVNMRRRLTDIGGSCSLESGAGRGTTVEMRLLLPVTA